MVAPDPAVRTDGGFIGKAIKEVIRLTLEEGLSWQLAADQVGVKRTRVHKAMIKPHVRQYAREQRRELIEQLSARVPLRLSQLMDGDNEASGVRACLALEQMRNEALAEPNTRHIVSGGFVLVLGNGAQRSLPQAAPALELLPETRREADEI